MATALKSITTLDCPKNIDFGVTTCFIEYKGKYLVLQRGRKDAQYGLWGIPGGKLEKGESPLSALSREIFEETGIIVSQDSFTYLDRAYSTNPHDGRYILYLYKAILHKKPLVLINTKEHLDFQWSSLDQIDKLDLLVSQGLAIDLVKEKLISKYENERNAI